MTKILVIDYLNKLAKGEKVPNIRYHDRLLKYNEEENWFDEIDGYTDYCKNYILLSELNEELEIIGEDNTNCELQQSDYNCSLFNKKIEKIDDNNRIWEEQARDLDYLIKNKIDEIIDKLDKCGKR